MADREQHHDGPASGTVASEAPNLSPAEVRSQTALAVAEPQLEPAHLLSFYDRLRERVVRAASRKGKKLPTTAVNALLLVPDVFMLLVRLTLDKEVPGATRALIGGALAYFVLPTDLLPEALIGGAGYLDDLVIAAAVLSQAFGGDLERYARRHWSGSEELRTVLLNLTASASSLLDENLYARLKKLLGKRGIDLDS